MKFHISQFPDNTQNVTLAFILCSFVRVVQSPKNIILNQMCMALFIFIHRYACGVVSLKCVFHLRKYAIKYE